MATQVLEKTKTVRRTLPLPTAEPPRQGVFDSLSAADQVMLHKLLSEPIDFAYHPDFARKGIERELFGEKARLIDRTTARFVDAAYDIEEKLNSSTRIPTLSLDSEQRLFKRYNFARFRIATIFDDHAGSRLTAAVTRRLVAWGHRALAARSLIVRLNMPLVLAMGKRTRLTNMDFNELVSEGNMALLRSVEKFDCSRGFKFSTYSCRAILKSFSRVAMRVSRYRGRFPAEYDTNMERSDFLERKRENVEFDCVDELKEILLSNLAELSDVERTVIRERFALEPVATDMGQRPKTLEQVGRIIGVTKERVRQIQNKALLKIKSMLEIRYLAA